ncbi:hypothetical protein Cabther_B0742 [Chloracidobacterium thermophilum B]|uniref:Uncharacterized protein n=1 Tax=Chloracidobacterium thermophilum (strain B) TaxID=981222 RepID=G2LL63_CHLTF|nr:hypothetical protein Cabther_B0742 [Chloracidobacterium thermophilum B]
MSCRAAESVVPSNNRASGGVSGSKRVALSRTAAKVVIAVVESATLPQGSQAWLDFVSFLFL